MVSITTDSLDEFLERLASRAGTPGGGSGSALVGAVAAALCGMVGRLNDPKTGAPGPLHDTIETADALRRRLTRLIDEDISAFEGLMAAWRLPEDDAERHEKKQAATVAATEAPLAVMSAARDVMQLAAAGLARSKKNCRSDAGVAGFAAHAALEGARLNVFINLPGIADSRRREALKARADALRAEADRLREEIAGMLD